MVRGDALWLCLAAVYAALLAQSWRADTLGLMFPLAAWPPLPRLTGIAAMFTRPAAAAASWVHLLALDLFVARFIFEDAARARPRLPAAHSLLACMMFGPSGLLCHAVTRAACERAARHATARAAAEARADAEARAADAAAAAAAALPRAEPASA